jgi:WD40 repeat protein
MHVGEIGGDEVVVTTDNCGQVAVHFPPGHFGRAPILLKVPHSAWGIDTHSSNRLLAVSCNAHVVTLFHLGLGIDGWEWTTRTPSEIVLSGHRHNIPCVGFDMTGEIVASGSLDRTVHLWKCRDGSLLRKIKTEKGYSSYWIINVVSGQSSLSINRIFCIINVHQRVTCLSIELI